MTTKTTKTEQYVARYFSPDGTQTVLYWRGRTKLHVVLMDSPIKRVFLPREEERYMTPLDYPVARAKRRFRAAARSLGIRATARRLLRG